jgi:hypothetical protein
MNSCPFFRIDSDDQKPEIQLEIPLKSESNKLKITSLFSFFRFKEQSRAEQFKRDEILRLSGIFAGIVTLTLFTHWLLSRFARKYYQLAKPAQDHARTEPLMDFITTVFPIITFKTTRWNALNFLKSQFRRRVAMALMAVCVFIATSECHSNYQYYREITLEFYQEEPKYRRPAYLARVESKFHQSIFIAIILASVMGSLFIVPKHLSRKDTDKGIAPTPAG